MPSSSKPTSSLGHPTTAAGSIAPPETRRSWAPFIVAAASRLRQGGRIAFVVPAEIGHAPYAVPLLDYRVGNFGTVHVVAVKEEVFPRLSEDCWLLFAHNAGRPTDSIRLSRVERFVSGAMPPPVSEQIPVDAWRTRWRGRLRPFLLPRCVRSTCERMAADPAAVRLGQIARVGIGYVSGANDPPRAAVPGPVQAYLDTAEGRQAKASYKCRNRTPWYTVLHEVRLGGRAADLRA